ncbi:MAG: HAD family phosphatase [Chloroflexota bacterium]
MTAARGGPPDLTGIDLVIFDKDGTLVDFHGPWGEWAETLADRIDAATDLDVRAPLFAMLGYDLVTRRTLAHGALAATPMARLREMTVDVVAGSRVPLEIAETIVAETWHAPDPVAVAQPLANLERLFARLAADGRRIAVATTDDRDPTERTLAALGVSGWVEAIVAADDGVRVKPAPDMVLHLAASLGVRPERCAVIGDAPKDLVMGRAGGVGLVVGVLSGVGTEADLSGLADVLLDSIGDLLPMV